MSSLAELIRKASEVNPDMCDLIGRYIDDAMEHEDREDRPTILELRRLYDFAIYYAEVMK